jgi:hypothetical protein
LPFFDADENVWALDIRSKKLELVMDVLTDLADLADLADDALRTDRPVLESLSRSGDLKFSSS